MRVATKITERIVIQTMASLLSVGFPAALLSWRNLRSLCAYGIVGRWWDLTRPGMVKVRRPAPLVLILVVAISVQVLSTIAVDWNDWRDSVSKILTLWGGFAGLIRYDTKPLLSRDRNVDKERETMRGKQSSSDLFLSPRERLWRHIRVLCLGRVSTIRLYPLVKRDSQSGSHRQCCAAHSFFILRTLFTFDTMQLSSYPNTVLYMSSCATFIYHFYSQHILSPLRPHAISKHSKLQQLHTYHR